MRNYHKDLLNYLGDGNELVFPSIGSLLLSRSMDYSPIAPSFFLDFNSFSTVNYPQQLKYFSDMWGKTEIEINRFFLRLSDNILALSQKEKTFEFKGVGKFQIVKETVVFQSEGRLERMMLKYHRVSQNEISFESPIIRSQSMQPVSIQEESVVTTNNESVSSSGDRTYVSRPLHSRKIAAVLLVFVTAFSAMFVFNNYASDFRFPAHYELKDSGYSEGQINRAPVVTDIPDNQIEVEGREEQDNEESEVNMLNDKSQEQDLQLELDELEEVAVSEREEVGIELSVEEKNYCIYILGSFGSAKNIKSLKSKISAMGLTTFSEEIGKLTRIGAEVSCDDAISISQLKLISPDMWLL